MPRKYNLALGLLFAIPALILTLRAPVRADGLGLLGGHRCQSSNCEGKTTVVQLPAQQIRVETAAPRVIVGAVAHHQRAAFLPAAPAFAPVASGPFVATFVPMNAMAFGPPPPAASSTALDALHALDRQAMELSMHRAALKAQMDHVDSAYKRVHASLAAPAATVGDATTIQQSIDALTKRVSDIERLLIIHDNILKDKVAPKQP